MNAVAKQEKRVGKQTPTRFFNDPTLTACKFTSAHANALKVWGINAFPWQLYLLRESLMKKGNGLAYKSWGLSVPRQNGKSEVIVMRILLGVIYYGDTISFTSYRDDSAKAIYHRIRTLINGNKVLRSYFPASKQPGINNNKERHITAIHPKTGEVLGRADFGTRTGGGGRGLTYSLIIFDEAQELTEDEVTSLVPTGATYQNQQVWYVGTPTALNSSATLGNSSQAGSARLFFTNFRAKIFKGNAVGAAFYEWGVDKITAQDNRAAWYIANPSLGLEMGKGRGLTEDIFISSAMSLEAFNTEHLGYWSVQSKSKAIDVTQWRAQKVEPRNLSSDVLALGLKYSPTSDRIALSLAIKKATGKIYVQALGDWSTSVDWITPLTLELEKAFKSKRLRFFLVDAGNTRGDVEQILVGLRKWSLTGNKAAQGIVHMATVQEIGQAAPSLATAVNTKTVEHSGQDVIDAAVMDSAWRKVGTQGKGFASASGHVDSTALESVALAHFAAMKLKSRPDDIKGDTAQRLGVSIVSRGLGTPVSF